MILFGNNLKTTLYKWNILMPWKKIFCVAVVVLISPLLMFIYHGLIQLYICKLYPGEGWATISEIGNSFGIVVVLITVISLYFTVHKQNEQLQLSRDEMRQQSRERARYEVIVTLRSLSSISDTAESQIKFAEGIAKASLARLLPYCLDLFVEASKSENERLKVFAQAVIDDNKHTLTGLDLSHQRLRGIQITNGSMQDTCLIGTDFIGANLSHMRMWRAKADGADFNSANLEGVMISDASCVHAHFNYAKLQNAIFIKSNLTGACFSNATFGNTDFTAALLVEAIFILSAEVAANFTNADLRGASFEYCNLNKARGLTIKQLVKCKSFRHTMLPVDLHDEVKKLCPDKFKGYGEH